LFVARSNVVDNINIPFPNRRYPEPNSVFRNLGNGKFQEVSATAGPDFQLEAPHRGVAFGDFDNDGRIDMVVSVLGGPVKLFHNISSQLNHWILLNLVGTRSNRMAIGAQVRVSTEDGNSQWNQVSTAVGYASSSDSRVHFGLGANRRITQIQIRWPSGIQQEIHNVDVDRVMTIEEPHH
jgi:enediyne biosynthesis protein E4